MARAPQPSVRPGPAPPWWLVEARLLDEPEAPPLAGNTQVDVAVVGGGYTGLWTALALRQREPGLRIAVLERMRCGEGPSGRNGGHLYGYWSSVGGLRGVLDDERLLELARAGDRIIPAVRAFVEERGEDVWLREAGAIKVSTTPAQDAKLDAACSRARARRPGGGRRPRSRRARRTLPVVALSERRLFRDGATLQPARLVKALRHAVRRRRIDLYERTPVVGLHRGDPNRLETPGGTLEARAVVLAVNAAATGWRPAAGRLTNFGSYIVLTEPVPELLEELGWTGGEAMTDARMFLHYFRTTKDGRVLMGSGSGPIGLGGRGAELRQRGRGEDRERADDWTT